MKIKPPDPWAFEEVTAESFRDRFLFFSEGWKDIPIVGEFWSNIKTSGRFRRGKLYMNSWGPYAIICWYHKEELGESDAWYGTAVVLQFGGYLLHTTALADSFDKTKYELEWNAWLALLDNLGYIYETLNDVLT